MAKYTHFQDTASGKQMLTELVEKGINIEVKGAEQGTNSVVLIDGKEVFKGVIPMIKGYISGLHYAHCK